LTLASGGQALRHESSEPSPRHARCTLKSMPDLRERALTSGVDTLPDQDLLALLLGTGGGGQPVTLLAAALLEAEGGLLGLARCTPHGFSRRRGIGPVKAIRIAAAIELGRRAQITALGLRPERVHGYAEVVEWARPRLATLEHEEVWLLTLDGQNSLKSARRIAQGGAHGCALTTRDVLAPALRDAASAIVLVHNHPSGDPQPSPEDIAMTRAVAAACEIVGVPLVDHVVVARGGASSIFDDTT
jgi:DNA repair protein RadC